MILRNISVESILIEDKIDKIINMYQNKDGILIQLLLDVQRELGWMPYEAIKRISEKLKIPVSQIYRVASFYAALSLEPVGRHLIQVCLGTACHVRGGSKILEIVEDALGIKAGSTTSDMKFTLSGVNCLGCCAQGPMLLVDDDYHGGVTATEVKKILKKYEDI